jgi:hypothetical protein
MRLKGHRLVRTLLLFVLVLFVPVLRSCGHLSYGFPTVALSAADPFQIQSLSPGNLAINLAVLAALFLVVYAWVFRTRAPKPFWDSGLNFVLIYHALTYFGFWAVYWLNGVEGEVAGNFVGAYSLLLYGPFLAFTPLNVLQDFSSASSFFGDSLDISLRVAYLVMVLVWFFAGLLVHALRTRIRPT